MYIPFANTAMILIGNGVMGKRHAARLTELGANVERIADDAAGARDILNGFHREPGRTFALIASPASTHAEHVRNFLTAGYPVFVEKPLATTEADADALNALAKSKNLPLFVGHSERYHPAMPAFTDKFKEYFAAGKVAEIRTRREACSERCRDVSVIFDFLVHDLDLLHLLLGTQIADSVQIKDIRENFDSVKVSFSFASGICAEMSADRKSPARSRSIAAYNAQGEALCEVDLAVPIARQCEGAACTTSDDALAREYRAFAEVLRNPRAGSAALESAAWAVGIAERIHSSAGIITPSVIAGIPPHDLASVSSRIIASIPPHVIASTERAKQSMQHAFPSDCRDLRPRNEERGH